MSNKETIDFIKTLENNKLIKVNSHKNEKAIETIGGIISMSEEEHDKFQENNSNQSVLMIFTEYQDWKETYEG